MFNYEHFFCTILMIGEGRVTRTGGKEWFCFTRFNNEAMSKSDWWYVDFGDRLAIRRGGTLNINYCQIAAQKKKPLGVRGSLLYFRINLS